MGGGFSAPRNNDELERKVKILEEKLQHRQQERLAESNIPNAKEQHLEKRVRELEKQLENKVRELEEKLQQQQQQQQEERPPEIKTSVLKSTQKEELEKKVKKLEEKLQKQLEKKVRELEEKLQQQQQKLLAKGKKVNPASSEKEQTKKNIKEQKHCRQPNVATNESEVVPATKKLEATVAQWKNMDISSDTESEAKKVEDLVADGFLDKEETETKMKLIIEAVAALRKYTDAIGTPQTFKEKVSGSGAVDAKEVEIQCEKAEFLQHNSSSTSIPDLNQEEDEGIKSVARWARPYAKFCRVKGFVIQLMKDISPAMRYWLSCVLVANRVYLVACEDVEGRKYIMEKDEDEDENEDKDEDEDENENEDWNEKKANWEEAMKNGSLLGRCQMLLQKRHSEENLNMAIRCFNSVLAETHWLAQSDNSIKDEIEADVIHNKLIFLAGCIADRCQKYSDIHQFLLFNYLSFGGFSNRTKFVKTLKFDNRSFLYSLGTKRIFGEKNLEYFVGHISEWEQQLERAWCAWNDSDGWYMRYMSCIFLDAENISKTLSKKNAQLYHKCILKYTYKYIVRCTMKGCPAALETMEPGEFTECGLYLSDLCRELSYAEVVEEYEDIALQYARLFEMANYEESKNLLPEIKEKHIKKHMEDFYDYVGSGHKGKVIDLNKAWKKQLLADEKDREDELDEDDYDEDEDSEDTMEFLKLEVVEATESGKFHAEQARKYFAAAHSLHNKDE